MTVSVKPNFVFMKLSALVGCSWSATAYCAEGFVFRASESYRFRQPGPQNTIASPSRDD